MSKEWERRFVTDAAREPRTPLTAQRGFTELDGQGGPPNRLLANFRVHTPAGTLAQVAVRLRRESVDGQAKVFERFWRADSSPVRRSGGTGLGLAIVSSLVEAHGGTIEPRSEPGQGGSLHRPPAPGPTDRDRTGRFHMNESRSPFEIRRLPAEYDVLAPDGSEIRVLPAVSGASMAHGTLPPGGVSLAVTHRTVEEIWYVLDGEGEVWRKHGDYEEVVAVGPGTALTIPLGTHFQFRTIGDQPFRFIMCTIPPWPGPDEAIRVPDHWPVV